MALNSEILNDNVERMTVEDQENKTDDESMTTLSGVDRRIDDNVGEKNPSVDEQEARKGGFPLPPDFHVCRRVVKMAARSELEGVSLLSGCTMTTRPVAA